MEEVDQPEGLTYPCLLDIKLFMESNSDNFTFAREILLKHVPIEDLIRISDRSSSKGKYQSLSCKVRATSQEQMDQLFADLTSNPRILMVI